MQADNYTFELRKGRASTSRQIWIKTEKGDINTNLRIRFTLNNGLGALFGVNNGQNKTSVPTFKLQQDKVDQFISECVDKTMCSY